MPDNKYKDDNKSVNMPFNGSRGGMRNRRTCCKTEKFQKDFKKTVELFWN